MTTSTTTTSMATTPVVCNTSNILWELWQHARGNLTTDELKWFTGATEHACGQHSECAWNLAN